MDIDKNDYSETLDFSEQVDSNWRALLKEAEKQPKEIKKKKTKTKKKK